MLRILKIAEATSAAAKSAIAEAQDIIRAQFPGMPERDIAKLPDLIGNPFKYRFLGQLLIAEDADARLKAIAVLLYAADLHFAYLDIISTAPRLMRGGFGAALYDRVREEALALGAEGLYFECLPDDPALSPDEKTRRQNIARLRFYERFGARPILGTAYETPVDPEDTDSPYLVFDGLGRYALPGARRLKRIVRAILERKYGDRCPADYVAMVEASIRDGAFALRGRRYVRDDAGPLVAPDLAQAIPLIVNDCHEIHHVHDRGYVEAPVRVSTILKEIETLPFFDRRQPRHFGDRHIREVHAGGLVDYIERACAEAPEKRSVYPYVFPIRNAARRPRDRSVLAGYWCIDTFTPLNRAVYPAARRAVDCALTAAAAVADGAPAAYALVRPPGHHAERRAFGGFCYFSNTAIAAHYLSKRGRVAILDIDYHHGNGQQDIFYERDDVLTVSIHGHPRFAYPYFTGFSDETGRGRGAGFNLNIPLPEDATPAMHREAVEKALKRIDRFGPDFLVVAFGLDTAKGDPTGTWSNRAADFRALGRLVGGAGYPTLVVQEGGYRIRTLGINARHFFLGLAEGLVTPRTRRRRTGAVSPAAVEGLEWRWAVGESDLETIRRLAASTGVFSSAEVEIAVEIAAERIAKGRASGYEFLFAEDDGRVLGYACFGPTPGTEGRYDLYWIVVDPRQQGRGIGRALHDRVEAAVREAGGVRLYVETSTRDDYAATRRFYKALGYRREAVLKDFYRDGDGKLILMKELG